MKTINVRISDTEYKTFGFKKSILFFSELVNLVEQQVARQALRYSVELAEANGLSSMTMDDINSEIRALRLCKA